MATAQSSGPKKTGQPEKRFPIDNLILNYGLLRLVAGCDDQWILDSSFYEAGFYVDYQFQSEEEQGFVPLIWEYTRQS